MLNGGGCRPLETMASGYIPPSPQLPAGVSAGTDPREFPQPAGFWVRVGARIIDFALLYCPQLVVIVLAARLNACGLSFGWTLAVILGVPVLMLIAYFSWAHSRGRSSLGYWVMGLRVRSDRDQDLSRSRALARAILSLLGYVLLWGGVGFLDYVWIQTSPEKLTLHDRIMRTKAVQVRPAVWSSVWPAFFVLLLVPFWIKSGMPFPMRAYYLPSGSMENTFQINDRILSNKTVLWFRQPRDGDILLFHFPKAALALNPTGWAQTEYIKRCIGIPGEVVEVKNGVLFRNGRAVPEPFVKWDLPGGEGKYDLKVWHARVYERDRDAQGIPAGWQLCPDGLVNGSGSPVDPAVLESAKSEPIPSGCYLLLGDNRANSMDSHYLGFVTPDLMTGRVMGIFWPPNHYRGF